MKKFKNLKQARQFVNTVIGPKTDYTFEINNNGKRNIAARMYGKTDRIKAGVDPNKPLTIDNLIYGPMKLPEKRISDAKLKKLADKWLSDTTLR